MEYQLVEKDKFSKARAGTIFTDHGKIETPIFMPVGTIGTVKGIHQRELNDDLQAPIILGNTYHLYLRPGTDILEQAGGLHKFINWQNALLTDSGGYQVHSLSETRKISEQGVEFRSHIDGSKHFFSPEKAIAIQRSIGADIIMAFDECTPYPCDYKYAQSSMEMTHRWLNRCFDAMKNYPAQYDYNQTLFPIVQGSTYPDLRKKSAEYIANKDAEGNAIGGLSVGEPDQDMYEMTDLVTDVLPKSKPRYLMGVGTPTNLLENIARGVDMFDCVMPTRNARNGGVFTATGNLNIKNSKWRNDFAPLDDNAYSWVDTYYSKAYLRHLFTVNELLGKQIASIHNIGFYLWLVKEARKQIISGDFSSWKSNMVNQMQNKR